MHETEIHSNTIEKLKRGSYEAFDTLYDMYADSLYGFALLHTKSSVQAEDIVQDTFLKLWNMRASLSVEGSFKSMLFTIAKNHVIDVFRQQINRPDFEDYIRFCEDEYNPQNHPDEFLKRNGSVFSEGLKRSGSILSKNE